MKREQYLQFLRSLRGMNDLKLACDMAESNRNLDAMIAVASMDPGAEETKKITKVWDGLREAALQPGGRFTFTEEAEVYGEHRAAGESVDANAEVTRIYIERVSNYVVPMSWAGEFFTLKNLADDEMAYLQYNSLGQVRVAKVGQDGGIRSTFVTKFQDQDQVPLFIIASQKVKWRLWDLLRGNVADENEKLVNIAKDVELELDGRLLSGWLAPSIGNFTFTGAAERRTLNLHSTIPTANLPSTNAITGLTAAGGVNKAVLDAVFAYCSRFANLDISDLYPVAFYYPSRFALSITGDITLTNAAAGTADLAKQVFTKGFIDQYLNCTLAYRPLANLAGKYVYVRTNKPVGTLYRKPGADRMIRKTDEELNEGSAMMRMAFGAVVPEPNRVNLLRIQVEA
jgi:hypothetical protein